MQDIKPDRYAVAGNPVSHSKSPEIHRLFAEQTGELITYEKIHIEPNTFINDVKDFFEAGGKGLNITAPFKVDAYNFVTHHTKFAKNAGAVNTIIPQGNNNFLGANTDGIGLLRDLKKKLRLQISGKKVLIIGAGGATQGIIEPLLLEQPHELIIANRTLEKAAALVEIFADIGSIRGCGLDQIPKSSYDLILHATSASVNCQDIELPREIISSHSCCYDLTYSDSDTPFMQWGRENGALTVVDGLGMLIEQAAESFYLWRDKRPDTSMVYNNLRASKA